jgi:hypothetical protein
VGRAVLDGRGIALGAPVLAELAERLEVALES